MRFLQQSQDKVSLTYPQLVFLLPENKFVTNQGPVDYKSKIQTFDDYFYFNVNKNYFDPNIIISNDSSKNIYTYEVYDVRFTYGYASGYFVIDNKYVPLSTYNPNTNQIITRKIGTTTPYLSSYDPDSNDVVYTDTVYNGWIDNKFGVTGVSIYKLSNNSKITNLPPVILYYEYLDPELEDILMIRCSASTIVVAYTNTSTVKSTSTPDSKHSIATIVDQKNKILKNITVTTDTGDGTPGFVMRTISNYNDESSILFNTQKIELDNKSLLNDSDFTSATSTTNKSIVLLHEINGEKYISVINNNTYFVFYFDETNNKMIFKDKTIYNFLSTKDSTFIPVPPNYTVGFHIEDKNIFNVLRFTPSGWKYYGETYKTRRIIQINDDLFYTSYSFEGEKYYIYREKLSLVETFDIIFEKQSYYYDGIHDIDTFIKLIKSNETNLNYRLKLEILSDNAYFTKQETNSIFLELTPDQIENIIPITIVGSGNVNIEVTIIDKFDSNTPRTFNVSSTVTLKSSHNVTVLKESSSSEG